jgi:hypothetical protein
MRILKRALKYFGLALVVLLALQWVPKTPIGCNEALGVIAAATLFFAIADTYAPSVVVMTPSDSRLIA